MENFTINPITRLVLGLPPVRPAPTPEQLHRERHWDYVFERHIENHEQLIEIQTRLNAEAFKAPEAAKALGVDGELPEFTRLTLGRATATDVIGPFRPKRSNYHPDGNEPTVLHRYK